MERARTVRGEQWQQLHNVLASAAVMNPEPMPRARFALAMAVGERDTEELDRAEQIMTALLGAGPGSAPALSPAMRDLLLVQRDLLRAGRAARERIGELERKAARERARLSDESASHARTRAERDEARAALSSAREKLREVTRIELKHEASGS